jgi:hypothetical protein
MSKCTRYEPLSISSDFIRLLLLFVFHKEFAHTGDMCYIAHCYPYTFTDLKDDLDRLSSIRAKTIFRREILCETQAGNSCFLVTVTDECMTMSTRTVDVHCRCLPICLFSCANRKEKVRFHHCTYTSWREQFKFCYARLSRLHHFK